MSRSEWVVEPKDFIRSLGSSARTGTSRIRIPSSHAMAFRGNAWNPGFFSTAFARGKREALDVVLDVLSGRLL